MGSTDQGWSSSLNSFDLFPKLSDEVRIKTYSGELTKKAVWRKAREAIWNLFFWLKISPVFFLYFLSAGAVISLLAGLCIGALLISEFSLYLTPQKLDRLYVDHTSRTQKLPIAFDITFPHVPCPLLILQTMDVAGTSQLDIDHKISKQDVLPNGTTLASVFS